VSSARPEAAKPDATLEPLKAEETMSPVTPSRFKTTWCASPATSKPSRSPSRR
jgi:hypothetical protein